MREAALVWKELNHSDTARVGAKDNVVFRASGEAERGNGSDNTKNILRNERCELARVRIGTKKRQARARGCEYLLFFGPRK